MPKVADAYRKSRRSLILDSAQRVFSRKGYRGASLADIVNESGWSTGAIYSYFDSKESIFVAVVERALTVPSPAASEPTPAPRPPGLIAKSVLTHLRDQPIMALAPLIWAETSIEPGTRDIFAHALTRLNDALEDELTAWAALNPDGTAEGLGDSSC